MFVLFLFAFCPLFFSDLIFLAYCRILILNAVATLSSLWIAVGHVWAASRASAPRALYFLYAVCRLGLTYLVLTGGEGGGIQRPAKRQFFKNIGWFNEKCLVGGPRLSRRSSPLRPSRRMLSHSACLAAFLNCNCTQSMFLNFCSSIIPLVSILRWRE